MTKYQLATRTRIARPTGEFRRRYAEAVRAKRREAVQRKA